MSRSPFRFCPRVFPLEGILPASDPEDVELFELARRIADRPGLALLDPGPGSPTGWGLLAFDPLVGVNRPDGLSKLRSTLASLEPGGGDRLSFAPGTFQGGFVGALAYDLGVVGEELSLPPNSAGPFGFPPIVGGIYTDFIAYDDRGRPVLVLGEEPGDGRAAVSQRRDDLFAALGADPRALTPARPTGPLEQHTSDAEFARRIETVRTHIAAGDLYQANLSQRFSRSMDGHPLELYGSLRQHHPAPFRSYLRFAEGALLSASPELLLEVEPGERACARTRPIKGTIARSSDPAEDRAAAERLRASQKDLAELAMIVDLERNDLGRVARIGTVRTEGVARLESYANVHHLLADVHAELRPGVDVVEVLSALFPGGSITGAPKLASMELIAELEGEGRGFAYGGLGFMDLGGRALFNLLIRSLSWRPGEVTYRVGGGITWASEARAEVQESWTKGERLAASMED